MGTKIDRLTDKKDRGVQMIQEKPGYIAFEDDYSCVVIALQPLDKIREPRLNI